MSKKKIVLFIIAFLIFCGIISSITNNSTNTSSKIPEKTEISNFDYEIVNDSLTLNKYKGVKKYIIISDTYNINGVDYKVRNFDNSIFNGCNASVIYIPKTLECIYDNTLAYLHNEHIDIYYEGSEDEWNNIFTTYTPSSAKEEWDNGNAKEAGEALADKLNSKIGHQYDTSKFTYHFNSTIESIILN